MWFRRDEYMAMRKFASVLAVFFVFAAVAEPVKAVLPEKSGPRMTIDGDAYGGWKLTVTATALVSLTIDVPANTDPAAGHLVLVLDRSNLAVRAGGGGGGTTSDLSVVHGGVALEVVGPTTSEAGALLDPGDYAFIAASPGERELKVTLTLDAPATVTTGGSLSGPAYGFTDADFAVAGDGTKMQVLSLDYRSIHSSVAFPIADSLFAVAASCSGSLAVTSPSGADFTGTVFFGESGAWQARLDVETRDTYPNTTCGSSLAVVDVDAAALAL